MFGMHSQTNQAPGEYKQPCLVGSVQQRRSLEAILKDDESGGAETIVPPRKTIFPRRNNATNYVAMLCDWLARFLPAMSEINFAQLPAPSPFLKRNPQVAQRAPTARPHGLGLPTLIYCGADNGS